MKPKCFCKTPVPNCPKCTAPDYTKFRPSSGLGNAGKMLKIKQALVRSPGDSARSL